MESKKTVKATKGFSSWLESLIEALVYPRIDE